MDQYENIICQELGGVGCLTLNSERTLNSLTVAMINEIHAVLTKWKADPRIFCVFLQGAGEKAFCAGGDVRKLSERILSFNSTTPKNMAPDKVAVNTLAPASLEFFVDEYSLDYEVHRYPKPIVAWLDAITMGGGIGLTNGASHRVVTERSKLAMPEITIGLYPDVGGTWFLNKIPDGIGLFVGLTGARLNSADSLFAGLSDFCVDSLSKDKILAQLQSVAWRSDPNYNHREITAILEAAAKEQKLLSSNIEKHKEFLSALGKANSVGEFKEQLLSYPGRDEWIEAATKTFEAGSPSSSRIILEQLRRGKDLDLEGVFRSELNLSCQCTIHPDFVEGVRALLIDKDQSPRWQPPTLEEVTHPLRDLATFSKVRQ
jgi:enoyl-CoA hydratase/carnithine racemase